MEFYDGAEVWELFGSHVLNKLWNNFDKESIWLYKDGGLGILEKYLVPQQNVRWKLLRKYSKCVLF